MYLHALDYKRRIKGGIITLRNTISAHRTATHTTQYTLTHTEQ